MKDFRALLEEHRQQADARRADAEVPDMFQRSDHAIKEAAIVEQFEEVQQKAAVMERHIQRLEELRTALLASGSAVQESPGAQLALLSEEDADYMKQACGAATSAEQPSPTQQTWSQRHEQQALVEVTLSVGVMRKLDVAVEAEEQWRQSAARPASPLQRDAPSKRARMEQ